MKFYIRFIGDNLHGGMNGRHSGNNSGGGV